MIYISSIILYNLKKKKINFLFVKRIHYVNCLKGEIRKIILYEKLHSCCHMLYQKSNKFIFIMNIGKFSFERFEC